MKYVVINANTGKVLGRYVEEAMAKEHADYINRNGGHAKVERIA